MTYYGIRCPNCRGIKIDIHKTGKYEMYFCRKCGYRWDNTLRRTNATYKRKGGE